MNLNNLNWRNLIIAFLIWLVVIAVSILVFPTWLDKGYWPIILAAWALVGVVTFIASFRKAFINPESDSEGVSYLEQVPSSPSDFVGRTQEIDSLLAAFNRGSRVFGFFGMGGIGKTVLAFALSHLVKDQFPDGALFIECRGLDDSPLTPDEIMAKIIRSHDPESKILVTEKDLAGIYQSVLANRREIILLDNTQGGSQVEPLIPPSSCLLITTSRQHFTLPGMHRIVLEVLPMVDAVNLICSISEIDEGHAEQIAALSGCLPLALRIAASTLAETPSLNTEEYLEQLSDARERLDFVEATFELSFRLLHDAKKSLWKMLSVFPSDFDAHAAIDVMALGKRSGPKMLSELQRMSLLDWNSHSRSYKLHDLLRIFANSKIEPRLKELGIRRFGYYYFELGSKLQKRLLKGGEEAIHALRRFDTEWENIKCAREMIISRSEEPSAAMLGAGFHGGIVHILDLRIPPSQKIEWAKESLDCARKTGDPSLIRNNLTYLGNAHGDNSDGDEALRIHSEALEIAEANDEEVGIAISLSGIGNAYGIKEDFDAMIDYHERSLEVSMELGDKIGQGHAYRNLCNALMSPLKKGCKIESLCRDGCLNY